MKYKKPLGIYIHIPYCIKKCLYCDFKSYSSMENTVDEYFNILHNEIIHKSKEVYDRKTDTVFIGGGTPCYVHSKYISDTLKILRNNFNIHVNCEISIECNPGLLTEEKLKTYFDSGINRISIGLQSAVDKELERLGRIHKYKDYQSSVEMILNSGIKNINTDIITGIPLQTLNSLKYTMNELNKYPLTHISAYSLIVEEGTEFYEMDKTGKLALPGEDEEREMYYITKEFLKDKGFNHYEISNYSLEGCECRHNMKYWNLEEYLGFGASAHSYMNSKRYWNYGDINSYISNGRMNKYTEGQEEITQYDSMKEFFMLGLRLKDGVNKDKFRSIYKQDPDVLFSDQIGKLIKTGIAEDVNNHVRLTEKGLDFANLAFMEFV